MLVHLPVLMADAFGISSSEARRLLKQGGVKLDGETLAAETPRPRARPSSTARSCRRASGASGACAARLSPA